ncbi:MAG TPA: alpha/beta fold hydrolase [Hydrogenophaga sp.]|uniref:alpha/beta fold hydrolase n=1 Tax=Hydrogenophaga sp. TaxID=1904254 RepID=UPI002C4EC6D5|nr:alpha/beta fold hydrolase [Hydrogenophaga sp.]HMN93819.1 alpha/beta fold hydrolase [Hydrogenophaga sp.]HMP09658.1 alpha/beta fold hydrolase [Hydrogenophaga sp.]
MRVLLLILLWAVLAVAWVRSRFEHDLAQAASLAAEGSEVLDTACGPIEVQVAGEGLPLLVVHGSGGGHDQGMAWARPLTRQGVRVVSVSRFGYLRTPRPADASPEAQADAHVCLMDALGIERAAILGMSAGAPSVLQTAIRHPQRVSALVLVVPIAYRPATVPGSAPPVSDDKDRWLLRLLGSDFLFWSAQKLARDALIRHLLATPPEHLRSASAGEQARVDELIRRILPVSARAAGLVDDTRLGKRLGPFPLDRVSAPTLLISARDDGFGTYAAAEYTASRIRDARFLGFDAGGHLLVGHDEAVQSALLELLARAAADAYASQNLYPEFP